MLFYLVHGASNSSRSGFFVAANKAFAFDEFETTDQRYSGDAAHDPER